MSKIGALLKVSALAGALALTAQAVDAASFKVPINYTVEVVDGKTSDFGYNRFTRTIDLSAGRHQIVLLFEGTFGASRDSRIYQAANPIVIDINNMPENAVYTFTYNTPDNERDAEVYARSQRISLIDGNTKAPLSQNEASYFLLTSDSGFSILRDYREDLASVGRLYAPAPVAKAIAEERKGNNFTAEGVPTVQARSSGGFSAGSATVDTAAPVVMSSTVTAAAAQQQAQAAATAAGQPQKVESFSSPDAAAAYNQMIQLYESADDSTKLKIVKYIMSH